jgi:SOS-response transcriptional repressor LexA
MGWASHAIAKLQSGETVVLRPRGNSMAGKVDDGDVVTVAPYDAADPQVGDVVLVKVKGREYLHLVKARQDERYLIGNNRGRVNGWVGRSAIYGRAICIESPHAYAERLQQARPKP